MDLFEKFEINKLRKTDAIIGGIVRTGEVGGGDSKVTDLATDNASIADSKGDCKIDTGTACDWTSGTVDCPPV